MKSISLNLHLFLAHWPKGPCELLPSLDVCCRHRRHHLQFFKNLLLRHHWTKLRINVPKGILPRTDVGIFDQLSNMAAVFKNRS